MLTRAAEDALFALYAVKLDLVSEAKVERALGRRARSGDPEARLADLLVTAGAIDRARADELLGRLDPELIPGYRIDGEAGRGGMGVVYRAQQLSMDRTVALKVLSRRLSRDQAYVAKFLAEARSAAKLNHENIVAAIDAGEADGLYYFAMEFVDGDSAADLLEAEGSLEWERAFEIAEQVARALHHAHTAGLVHRDVKPENIMINAEGQAKLCDLGLAKPTQVAGTGGKAATTEGTPYYCSPEQALGRTDIDPRSDVYSLGTTVFHLLAGEAPFDGDSARAILLKQVHEPFPELDERLPDVPAPLRRLLEQLVVKDREARLASMRAFEEGLAAARRELNVARALQARPAAPKRGPALAGAALGAVLLVGIGAATLIGGGASDPVDPIVPVDSGTAPLESEVTPPVGGDGTTPPRIGRVPPPGETGEQNSDPASGSGTTDSPGAALLAAARAYQREQPGDPWELMERLLEVTEEFPGSPAATTAATLLEEARAEASRLGAQAFEALSERVLGLVRERRFKTALELLASFEAAWSPRAVLGLPQRVAGVRRSVQMAARAALERAEQDLASGGAPDALEELAGELPPELASQARTKLQASARQAAESRWRALEEQAYAALEGGDLPGATQALADADLSALGPWAEAARQLAADLAGARRAGEVFARSLWALTEKARLSLTLRAGGTLEGRLRRAEAQTWSAELQPAAGGDPRALSLDEVAAHELAALALPPEEGRLNALYFLSRGDAPVAAAALDALVRAGGADDPGLRQRVARCVRQRLEVQAEQLTNRLLAPGASADEVVLLAREIPVAARATEAFRARAAAARTAFSAARAQQLARTPGELFRGRYEEDRRGRVTLTYRFQEELELEDWAPDLTAEPEAQAQWRPVERLVRVRGKLMHGARFLGGELQVDLRGEVLDGERPNASVIVGSRPGWHGVLVGLGFAYGALNQLRVDPAAERKPGYRVGLPAHVLLVLDGRAPRADMERVLAAEDRPTLRAGGFKLQLQRSDRGAMKLKAGGRTLFVLGQVPQSDEAGSVAIAPGLTELLVAEVVIEGVLDPTWIQERCAALAQAETDALFPPEPAKKD